MIELPNKKKCYNLPEQVAQNLLNIQYLAEQYKNIDALPAIWQTYKEEFDRELETFGEWTTTFEGWDNTLSTYLTNMSSAAVGAIAGQNITPASIVTDSISADGFVKPKLVADELDVDISVGGTQTDLPNLTQANCPITITYAHARISNGKLNIVFAGYLRPSEPISQALYSGNHLFKSASFQLSYGMSIKIFNESGSNIGNGFISWKRETLTYMQDYGAPAASSQSNGLAATVYRSSGYTYDVRLYVLDPLTFVYNSGYKYEFRFEFNYNL